MPSSSPPAAPPTACASSSAPRAAELLAGVAVASIGPVTTATAEKRGLTVAVTATVSTTVGLVEALERHFRG